MNAVALRSKQLIYIAEVAGIVLTILLLPVDRMPYLHHLPFHLGVISLLLLAVAVAGRLYQVVAARRFNELKRYAFFGLLFLLPVIGYAASISYALDKSLAHGATNYLLVSVFKGWCFFVLVSHTPELWSVIKKAVYAITAVIVGFALFQFVFDVLGASTSVTDLRDCCTSNSTYVFPRVHSVSIEPLYFAHFLLVPLWMMIFDFWQLPKARRNKWLIALFIATATIFVLTLGRSAFLGFAVAAIILALTSLKDKSFRGSILFLTKLWAVVIILSVGLIIFSGIVSQSIKKTALNGAGSGAGSVQVFSDHALNVTDDSAQTRYGTWPDAAKFFKEHPLKGVGAYNSRVELNLKAYQQGQPGYQLQPFNNDLLGVLVDLGLLGVAVFLPMTVALFVAFFRLGKMAWRSPAAPMALALIGMAVQSNFFHSILLARTWIVVGLTLVVFSAVKQPKAKSKKSQA